MSGIITKNYKESVIDNFYKDFETASSNRYYVFASRFTPWANGTPDENLSIKESIFDVQREMLFGKLLTQSDFSKVIRRINWSFGTVYDYWDQEDPLIYTKNFYVCIGDSVWKCLWNNNGGASTVSPDVSGVQDVPFTTNDGYIWIYVYTLPTSSQKFISTNYYPVGKYTPSSQIISANTTIGTLDVLILENGGMGWITTNNGFIQQVLSNNQFRIDVSASPDNFFYNDASIYISSGTGAGQISQISSYVVNSTGKFVTTSSNIFPLDITSNYKIIPTVRILGDGTGATGICTVNTQTATIDSIAVRTRGQGYTWAAASIVANNSYGNGAIIKAIVSPPGGHASDPYAELDGKGISIVAEFPSNAYANGINFAQIGILKNPNEEDPLPFKSKLTFKTPLVGNTFAIGETLTGQYTGSNGVIALSNTTLVYFSNTSGDFHVGETVDGANTITTNSVVGTYYASEDFIGNTFIQYSNNAITLTSVQPFAQYEYITGGFSGAVSKVVYANTTVLYTSRISGQLQVGEPITGNTSGATAVLTVINNPELELFSGEILFYQNIDSILRTGASVEVVHFTWVI